MIARYEACLWVRDKYGEHQHVCTRAFKTRERAERWAWSRLWFRGVEAGIGVDAWHLARRRAPFVDIRDRKDLQGRFNQPRILETIEAPAFQ